MSQIQIAMVDVSLIDICAVVIDAIERSKVQCANNEGAEWVSHTTPLTKAALREAFTDAANVAAVVGGSAMKVFRVNDVEWYMAETLDQAIALCAKDRGESVDEVADHPRWLHANELCQLTFVHDDGIKHSFMEELAARIRRGEKPGLFATTEY